PLAFGVDGVEGERRLAGAAEAGDDHELVARQLDVDVLQVVLARAADNDAVNAVCGMGHVGSVGAYGTARLYRLRPGKRHEQFAPAGARGGRPDAGPSRGGAPWEGPMRDRFHALSDPIPRKSPYPLPRSPPWHPASLGIDRREHRGTDHGRPTCRSGRSSRVSSRRCGAGEGTGAPSTTS